MGIRRAVIVAAVLLMCSNLRADYQVLNICVGDNNNQVNPDVYSDENDTIVVWEDPRHGSGDVEIYWVSLSDPNLINHRISQAGNQKFPAISGNTIVWQDERISTTNREVYTYNLSTSEANRLADTANQRYPEISNGWIVSESYNGSVYNAAVWDASANVYHFIAPNSAMQMELAMDGSVIVWRDDRDGKSQIWRCDLAAQPYAAAPVYAVTNSQYHPAVSGHRVAWHETTAQTLVVYDLLTQSVWTHELKAGSEALTSMSGAILVWQELHPAGGNYNIRGYDFSTGSYLDIATGTQDDRNPSISGRTVAWQRGSGAGTDIVAAVITAPAVIALTAPNGGEVFLAGSEIEIAWQMVKGAAPAAVDVEFSPANGAEGSWTLIGDDVPYASTLLWNTPADANSTECLVRVRSAGDPQVTDVSDAVFTIFQCSAALTADLTGDCFVDIKDFAALAAQWLTCGSPDESWCSGQ